MIFLTVGARKEGFERLVRMTDELVAEKTLKRAVFMQIGHTAYEPRHAPFVRFLPPQEYLESIARSTIVLCKGGAGPIIAALRLGKLPVVLPVEQGRGECGYEDDGILDLSAHLAAQGRLILVRDKAGLRAALNADPPLRGPLPQDQRLQDHLARILVTYLGQPS